MDVLKCFAKENPKILICAGAKRSGKTYILTYIFLSHIAKFKDMGLSFIIGGSTQSSIRRNILDDMEKILGKPLKLNKSNAVSIFGNNVYCFGGTNSDSWKDARGFTAAGAYLNEGTALHDSFIKEVISRCSYDGARVLIDTNPENPMHTVKTDYIDKDGDRLDNGQLNIKCFNFTLFDNEFLNQEYVESIIRATPSGMFTDRDIYGRWVAAEGVVYKDFNMHKHYISREELAKKNIKTYYAGLDWGYEHHGSIVVIGEDDEGIAYVVEEIAKQHEEIEYWVEQAKMLIRQYGNMLFYCDSARADHVKRFRREGIKAKNADKAVLSGIEQVAKRFKTDKLYIVDDVKRFKEEIFMYAWNERTGEPVKLWDDVLDSLRYSIFSHHKGTGAKI